MYVCGVRSLVSPKSGQRHSRWVLERETKNVIKFHLPLKRLIFIDDDVEPIVKLVNSSGEVHA